MNLHLSEMEINMLQTAITAKIKRCRNSINNNRRNVNPKDAVAKIQVRQRQIEDYNELLEKLKYVNQAKAEKVLQ